MGSVSANKHNSSTPPTPVVDSAIDDARKAAEVLNWSKLMARAQHGDQEAYRKLLEGVTPYLRSLAGRWLKEAADVEDAVQDVLLTIHMVRNTYDPTRPFGPWLVAIANRRTIDRLRGNTRRRAREVALSGDDGSFADCATNLARDMLAETALGRAIECCRPTSARRSQC
jgi:RNA polymerase sigma-70 factor (ECF subfamily)